MIWVILAFLGIPLWFCAIAIATLMWRNRSLRHRAGNMPVRVLRDGEKRWHRGHALWVHDVFAFRGSPAAWEGLLVAVTGATAHSATDDERAQLRRLNEPVAMTLVTDSGEHISVAGAAELTAVLPGPSRCTRPPAEQVPVDWTDLDCHRRLELEIRPSAGRVTAVALRLR